MMMYAQYRQPQLDTVRSAELTELGGTGSTSSLRSIILRDV